MRLKPVTTEKAIRKVELENTIVFLVEENATKVEIKREVEILFKVKVDRVRTSTVGSKKMAYVTLNKKDLAVDLATKLGLM